MYRGYFALYRKIQDHPFYKEKRVFSKYEAWIDLLMDARHKKKPKQIVIGMRTIECGYGQSIKSLRTMGERWGWTAKKVSRFLNLLENMGQIRHENVTVTTRITILNYSKYDAEGNRCDTDMPRDGNTRETQGKHEWDTNKHDNNENHDKHENNIGETPNPKTQTKFIKPTIEEIKEYCIERKNNVDPETFYDFYETSNWMRGKNKIKDWKACVRTWEKNQNNKGPKNGPHKQDFREPGYYEDSTADYNPHF